VQVAGAGCGLAHWGGQAALHRMQAWVGQAAALARPEPAGEIVRRLWDEAQALLPG
jgi:nitronate monooxygenase